MDLHIGPFQKLHGFYIYAPDSSSLILPGPSPGTFFDVKDQLPMLLYGNCSETTAWFSIMKFNIARQVSYSVVMFHRKPSISNEMTKKYKINYIEIFVFGTHIMIDFFLLQTTSGSRGS